VDRPINDFFIKRMSAGIPILGTVTDPCSVELITKFKFRIILKQGLNRQIRRMCEYLGYTVKQLKRIRIMNIHLDLPVGKWRDLSPKEMEELNRMIQDSSKTY
jgi:23S rRNA pseudouridine2604 synthase